MPYASGFRKVLWNFLHFSFLVHFLCFTNTMTFPFYSRDYCFDLEKTDPQHREVCWHMGLPKITMCRKKSYFKSKVYVPESFISQALSNQCLLVLLWKRMIYLPNKDQLKCCSERGRSQAKWLKKPTHSVHEKCNYIHSWVFLLHVYQFNKYFLTFKAITFHFIIYKYIRLNNGLMNNYFN